MYYNHNLRTNLQEWKNRLHKATQEQFAHQLKYCFSNINDNKILKGLMDEACNNYKYSDEDCLSIIKERNYREQKFNDETHHAAFCFQLLKYLIKQTNSYDSHNWGISHGKTFVDRNNNIIEEMISPIMYFFHDRLEKSSSVIYLLEKYKKRTEWFTREFLLTKYKNATNQKNYEKILEDDLRLFLFDQGIDYPFSTPKSASGRADIVSAIDTSDPLIVEIKIFDRERSYGKTRIKEGFTQILKYTNDYNKDTGYLVIFNADKAELNFDFAGNSKIFPPMLIFNNKSFYFITVNLFHEESASKMGITEEVRITEEDLIK